MKTTILCFNSIAWKTHPKILKILKILEHVNLSPFLFTC
jgi:hypothetical protein